MFMNAPCRMGKFTDYRSSCFMSNFETYEIQYHDDFWSKRSYSKLFKFEIPFCAHWEWEAFNPPYIPEKEAIKLTWFQKIKNWLGWK